MSSVQHKLSALRGPYIPMITLDVEIGAAVEKRELPFVVGILADFGGAAAGRLTPLGDRAFLAIDRDNFDQIIAGLQPALELEVEDQIHRDGAPLEVRLRFRGMDDFQPESVARQVEPLRERLEVRERLGELLWLLDCSDAAEEILRNLLHDEQRRDELRHHLDRYVLETGDEAGIEPDDAPQAEFESGTTTPAREPNPLEELCGFSRSDWYRARQKRFPRNLACFLDQFPIAPQNASPDPEAMLESRIAEIDAMLSRQLNSILHHGEFQRLEATWSGLRYLVDQSETSQSLEIRILNVSALELRRDRDQSPEFDASAVYQLIRQSGTESSRTEPIGLLVGDFEFGREEPDIALLEWISHIAAAAHAPFLAAASPAMFGPEHVNHSFGLHHLASQFDDPAYAGWQRFRESEDSRYVGLCVPRILLRLPYGTDGVPIGTFAFTEEVNHVDRSGYLWGNAAFALAARLTDAFARFHWFARVRGVEGGGRVEGLPMHVTRGDQSKTTTTGPTDVWLDDVQEFELDSLGFIPLVAVRGTRDAMFLNVSTCHRVQTGPAVDDQDPALIPRLPHVVGAGRFAQYLERIAADPSLASLTDEELAAVLNRWMAGHVAPEGTNDPRVLGRCPLSDARVVVTESPAHPGRRRVIADLKLRAQCDDRPASIRIIVGPIPRAPARD